ncbi:MAG: oligopeptide/dipeptide ABC transporter ATP-binding protein, partial [Spirochaetia bacterium]
ALASDLCDRLVVMYAGEIREEGSAEQVLVDPQDPYTQELLASIPRLHGRTRPGFMIGPSPDPISPPAGCRFHPRCPHAFDRCGIAAPPLIDLGGGRAARCWLHDDRIVDAGPVGDAV